MIALPTSHCHFLGCRPRFPWVFQFSVLQFCQHAILFIYLYTYIVQDFTASLIYMYFMQQSRIRHGMHHTSGSENSVQRHTALVYIVNAFGYFPESICESMLHLQFCSQYACTNVESIPTIYVAGPNYQSDFCIRFMNQFRDVVIQMCNCTSLSVALLSDFPK